MEFDATELLEGLEGRQREARLELLERLVAHGVPPAELEAAVREDRLALLPVNRILGGRHTAREVEQRTGLPAILLIRFRRLLGLSEVGEDERVFADEDVEAAQATKLFLDAGLSETSINEITRVLGESMARLAGTTTAAFVNTFLAPGDTEQDVALRFADLAEQLVPAVRPVLVAAYLAHLREWVGRGMLSRDELAAGAAAGTQELAICFADLVGFTRLGGEIELQELGTVAGTLASLAAEVTAPPVRLVKTIGDAAMFVSPEVEPLVEAALSLVEAVEDADLPALRAGIAFGPAIVRAGDYYGPSVNLASRVTGIARPGSVLCTAEVHHGAPDAFEWSFAGRHRLKGIAEPIAAYRARRPAAEGEEAADAGDERRARRRRRRER
jgi:adenylate cyclase